jgi:hypothetical protein
MIGLDLGGIDYFKNALNLQEAWVQTIDDATFLDNNLTYMFVWENKSDIILAESELDITGFFAGAFSDIMPYSYEFLYVESKLYWDGQYALMEKDISIWIQAILFTQMGNALKYKNAINSIDANN